LTKIAASRPTAALNVIPLEGSGEAWDRFIANCPHATFCHLAGWRDVMADTLRHECLFRVAVSEGGAWEGVLPLVRVKSRLFGHFLVSMPFLNDGGPVGTAAAQAALAARAVLEARRSGADLLELRTRHPISAGLSLSRRKITVVLDLPSSVDELWRDVIPPRLRNKVRRPQREGLEARFGSELAEVFYDIFARRMRELGTPVMPFSFFDRIRKVFADRVTFGVVFDRAEPLAAGCGFTWGGEFEMTWNADVRKASEKGANVFLFWSFLERAVARGLRHFNFGRCTPGSGTHEFKRRWGGVDVDLPWVQWSARGLASPPAPNQGAYRLATLAWRILPLNVTRSLGPLLAPYLP